MPTITTNDGVQLYYEDVGEGRPRPDPRLDLYPSLLSEKHRRTREVLPRHRT